MGPDWVWSVGMFYNGGEGAHPLMRVARPPIRASLGEGVLRKFYHLRGRKVVLLLDKSTIVKKARIIIIAICCFFVLFSILFAGRFLPGSISPAVVTINVGMDAYYHHFQYPIIKNEGNTAINNIVNDTAEFGADPIRLIKITEKITDNFSDMYWINQANDRYFCYSTYSNGKSEWTWCPPFLGIFGNDPLSYWYVFDKKGHVRTTAQKFIDLTYDPRWIAYQKTGACESLSVYFNETANRSGFVSRIVCSESAGHTWNEVMINGEWKYYDIQRYGQVKNTSESSFWFGNRSEFGIKSGFSYSQLTKSGICVLDLQTHKCGKENLTQNYLTQS